MLKYYISGPISGYKNKNQEAFEEAQAAILQLGINAVTPFDLNIVEPAPPTDWVANMKRDIRFVTTVDGIVVIDGWKDSKGANVEVAIARIFEIPIYELNAEGQLDAVYTEVDLAVTEVTLNEYLGGNPEEY